MQLKELVHLDLSHNSFSGIFPFQILSELTKLETFIIGNNKFTGVVNDNGARTTFYPWLVWNPVPFFHLIFAPGVAGDGPLEYTTLLFVFVLSSLP